MSSYKRNTRKSYGGSIQNNLKAQENILKKLKLNLKWKNVRQFTHAQRAEFPQKIANQQKVVNELRKLAASTTKINNAVTVIKNNVTQTSNAVNRINQVAEQLSPASAQNAVTTSAVVTANVAVNKSKELVALAMSVANRANTLSKKIHSMTGGKRNRRTRRN
uniref:Uncharacterized protein n=1 Tax=viral metagenome TaxID=1070528 RepID=A0A6C0KSR3_9ZZZZ